MKIVQIVITLILCFLGPHAQAQSRGIYRGQGHTEIVGDTEVHDLVKKHIEFNEQVKTIPGYRIQIAALSGNNSRTEAFRKKDEFKTAFPDVEAYVIFNEPNFKVLVGDFITRLDAFTFLQRCKTLFPGTIVKENIFPIHLDWSQVVPETDDDINN